MTSKSFEFGIVGLGQMGGNLALQALEKGRTVTGYTTGQIPEPLAAAGLHTFGSIAQLAAALESPRVVLLYVPAGEAVDEVLTSLTSALVPGDIVADCGNSYWGDSIRRYQKLKLKGIHFLDVGTSGGPAGARRGACFMVGG